MYNTAINYLELGLSVIPVRIETKSPAIQSWKPYQHKPMTPDQAWTAFNGAEAIAVITGSVSGNLIIIDFDNHFGDATRTLAAFKRLVDTVGMVEQSTPSGGYHLIYRTPNPGKNMKLAQRVNAKNVADTLIETRGEGGYALIDPSPGYTIRSGSFNTIRTLTDIEHAETLAAARSMNEYARPDRVFNHDVFGRDTERPGDVYNESSDAREEVPVLLSRAGWTTTDGRHYRRPGKDRGVSATWGKVTAGSVPLFYCFSTNGGTFEDQRSYKPFQIFALLAHNGDFESAARELQQRGFGAARPENKEVYKAAIKSIRKGTKLHANNFGELSDDLGLPEEDLKKAFEPIYEQHRDEFGFDQKTDIEKAEIFLGKNYEFRKNIVTQKIEMRRVDAVWQQLNDNTIYCEFQRNRIKYSFDKIKSLLRSNFVPEYDPFQDYFQALPEWDGVDYVFELAKHVDCDDQVWFAEMLTKHLVRAIRCALEVEYYNRIVFTIVSERQEIGKSFFIRWLNPFGTQYYSEEFLRDDKDSQFRLSENFIYNLEELDTLSKMDVGKLKAMISKSGVNERVPYESQKINLPRRCTFFGSTNRSEFLTDDRNSRWLVFNVKNFNRAYSRTLNVIDIWSQAWALYRDPDYNAELTAEESAWRDNENKTYQVQELERTIILEHLEPSDSRDEYMTNVGVMQLIVNATDNRLKLTNSAQKIGRIMSELGFQTGQKYVNGKNCRVYFVRAKDYLKRTEAPF